MTLLLEEPTAADDRNAQLLFKEARRRRRRLRIMWMAMGATVIVALVGLGLTLDGSSSPPSSSVGSPAHPVWPPHLRTGATLVYALNDLRILDADSGATRVLPLPAPYGGSRDLAMVTVGHSLLLNRGDTAWLYSGSINREARRLGTIGWSVQRSEQQRGLGVDAALCADPRMHELQRTPDGKRSLGRWFGAPDRSRRGTTRS